MKSLSPPAGDHATQRLFGLDVIRAAAIVMVVLSHTLPGEVLWWVPAEYVERFRHALGFLGVELFFVLSGFLIGGILLREIKRGKFVSSRGLLHFWQRRWFRTLPVYFLFLALNLFLDWRQNGTLTAGWWKYFWFGQNLVEAPPRMFLEAWSLAVEEWFYLLFPLTLFWLRKLPRLTDRSFLLCAAGFLVWPTLLRCGLSFGSWAYAVRIITVLRLDAVMFGVVLAYVSQEKPRWWRHAWRAWPAGLAGTAAVMLYFITRPKMDAASFVDGVFFFTFTSCSVSLLLPATTQWREFRFWLARPIQCLSLWSYSLYLCHKPVNTYLRPFIEKTTGLDMGKESLLRFCAVWACSVAIAALLYRFVEKPIMDLRERFGRAPTLPETAPDKGFTRPDHDTPGAPTLPPSVTLASVHQAH